MTIASLIPNNDNRKIIFILLFSVARLSKNVLLPGDEVVEYGV